jgi:hypothetical protein
MAGMRLKGFIGLMAAGGMLVTSTGAAAAGSATVAQQISPWATLTVLTGGAPAAAVCGAAVAATAAQPTAGCVLPAMDAPPPPPAPVADAAPPVPVEPVGFSVSPLLIGLVAIAAATALYFSVKDHHHGRHTNSPA